MFCSVAAGVDDFRTTDVVVVVPSEVTAGFAGAFLARARSRFFALCSAAQGADGISQAGARVCETAMIFGSPNSASVIRYFAFFL
jgi:hypothetical protein